MKFGKVDDPSKLDLSLPQDHPETKGVFKKYGSTKKRPPIYVGCAKWNKTDLKGFYPRGTKDELVYYSSQFNSIELNSTFYRIFSPEQFEKWKDKTPDEFKFFPKITQEISHWKQLKDVEEVVDIYLQSVTKLDAKLGTIFLQMREHFKPDKFDQLKSFIESWPSDLPLSVELRHTTWYNDESISNELYDLLESNGISNTLVDTAGRRDLMHMRMTNSRPFIRYVGANHESDYSRLDEWVVRISEWIDQGMTELGFFVHQNLEKASPLLSAHLIRGLNEKLGYKLKIPDNPNDNNQLLFLI